MVIVVHSVRWSIPDGKDTVCLKECVKTKRSRRRFFSRCSSGMRQENAGKAQEIACFLPTGRRFYQAKLS
jgi:hypothetical protein